MEKDKDITKVVFRWWNVSKDIIALFPDTWEYGFCNSYEHVGQHGDADYDGIIKQSRPATPEEYADLKAELESIGYNLKVMQRRCSWIRLSHLQRK